MGRFGTGGDEEQGRRSDVVVDVVVVVLGNWKNSENPHFEEKKGNLVLSWCSKSQGSAGGCGGTVWDGRR